MFICICFLGVLKKSRKLQNRTVWLRFFWWPSNSGDLWQYLPFSADFLALTKRIIALLTSGDFSQDLIIALPLTLQSWCRGKNSPLMSS